MDKTKLNLERLRAYDAEWDENKHPRADNGQFTSGGGSAGSGAESANKYGYSRSEQHVANKMKEWGNEQGNIAALEAADAFRDANEDEDDMREVLKSVRQHLVANKNEIRNYDDNPENFDKVMDELDDMESMLDDQDTYEFKHGEIKSPLRQAAEVMQGESKWEHKQNIKLLEDLEKAETKKDGKIVIGWIIDNMRNGMSAEEAFVKADKDIQNGMIGGGTDSEDSLRKWWKDWSSKWAPKESE